VRSDACLLQLPRSRNVRGVTESRPTERRWGLRAGVLSLALLACSPQRAEHEPRSNPGDTRSRPSAPEDARNLAANTATKAEPRSKIGKTRDAELAKMCQSLHDDYGDGTLSDFFSDLEITSAWARDLSKRAQASITPGRVLAAAAPQDTALPAPCRRLFEELDDLE